MNSTPSPSSSGLVRALGPLTAIAIVVGTVIGSGVFKKPRVVAEAVPFFGPAATAWVLGGVLALLGALALAEVAVLYPKAGGNYVFLREGYGRWAGFLFGWVEFWIIRSGSIAALATIFIESVHDILKTPAVRQALNLESGSDVLGFWPQKWLTVAIIMLLAMINVRGVRWGGYLQLFITLVKVGSLLGIMALPFVIAALVGSDDPIRRPHPEYLTPVLPTDWKLFDVSQFGAALVGVLWAYHGWMNIAPVAEEVKDPQRNIPFALLGGVGIITFLYLGANLAYYLVIPRTEIAACTNHPVVTEFAMRLLGPIGVAVASGVLMFSVFGALNGNLLVGPRLLYAMGEDGLAPRALNRVHPTFHTPAAAILMMAGWSSLLVLSAAMMSRTDLPTIPLFGVTLDLNLSKEKPLFDILTDYAMFGAVIFETLAVTTIFMFRRRFPSIERPYRCWGYPVVPAIYVGIMFLVLVNMFKTQRAEALTGVGFIAVGAVVFLLIESRSGRGAVQG